MKYEINVVGIVKYLVQTKYEIEAETEEQALEKFKSEYSEGELSEALLDEIGCSNNADVTIEPIYVRELKDENIR